MWFWWFMLFCGGLTPVLMLACGWMMWKHCPKTINGLIGYRTPRSMQNMDTWKFAHEYIGKLWWKVGWILLLPSIAVYLPFYGGTEQTISIVGCVLIAVQLVVLLCTIIPTEKALKKTFGEDGTRR